MSNYSYERNVELHFISAAMDLLNKHRRKKREFDFWSPTTQQEKQLAYDAKITGYDKAREVLIQFKRIQQDGQLLFWGITPQQHRILHQEQIRAFYIVHPRTLAEANREWSRSTTENILKGFLATPASNIPLERGRFTVQEARSEQACSLNGQQFLELFSSGDNNFSHELNLNYAEDEAVLGLKNQQLTMRDIWGHEVLTKLEERVDSGLCLLRQVR